MTQGCFSSSALHNFAFQSGIAALQRHRPLRHPTFQILMGLLQGLFGLLAGGDIEERGHHRRCALPHHTGDQAFKPDARTVLSNALAFVVRRRGFALQTCLPIPLDAFVLRGGDNDAVVLPHQVGWAIVAKDAHHRRIGEPDDAIGMQKRPLHRAFEQMPKLCFIGL